MHYLKLILAAAFCSAAVAVPLADYTNELGARAVGIYGTENAAGMTDKSLIKRKKNQKGKDKTKVDECALKVRSAKKDETQDRQKGKNKTEPEPAEEEEVQEEEEVEDEAECKEAEDEVEQEDD